MIMVFDYGNIFRFILDTNIIYYCCVLHVINGFFYYKY